MSWEAAVRWALFFALTTGVRHRVRARWVAYSWHPVAPGVGPGRWTYVVEPAGGGPLLEAIMVPVVPGRSR